MAWQGHREGDITRQQRRRIRARRYCEWPGCGVVVPAGTGGVDHRINLAEGGSSDDSNLWLLCSDHHDPKTRAEHKRGRQRYAARGKYDPGGHPAYL
ncbi:HNH endonuclease [Gordonia phage Agatha]|uniref:HNH endonuclease n=2 Tax=Emalynvirus cozz TaxID=2560490 RepID=A0A4Y5NZB2_9CAUD|nr:HNH endonuclease [Gordonia phage Agatha]QOP65328.1 HNH endonuclease [Gordonia phage Burnsey]